MSLSTGTKVALGIGGTLGALWGIGYFFGAHDDGRYEVRIACRAPWQHHGGLTRARWRSRLSASLARRSAEKRANAQYAFGDQKPCRAYIRDRKTHAIGAGRRRARA